MLRAANGSRVDGRRPLVIVALLSVSLLLVGILGWQAWRIQQANAAVAESVLREYAILVADEYGRRAMAGLGYYGYFPLVQRIADLPSPRAMREATPDTTVASNYFRITAGQRQIEIKDVSPGIDALLGRLAAAPPTANGPFMSARTDDGAEQVIYVVQPNDEVSPRTAGFVVNNTAIGELLLDVYESGPLLPVSLAGGRVSNEMLFLRVSDPAGAILFEVNSQYDSALRIEKALPSDYQGVVDGFTVQASLDPDSAAELIIGGLPGSRLPLLLIVMALLLGLMLAAIWLLRREQAVIRMRTDFVSQVSHELRTPLTQIRMFAETLLLDRVSNADDKQRALKIIDRESQRLSHLVDNILRFSGPTNGYQLDCRPQELAPIVREVCNIVQATTERVAFSIDADETVAANVDADALRQILLNVLDNALKYGPPDQEIRIELRARGHRVQLSVADQGPGIPEPERQKVWQSFYRLDREQQTAISGTGIGLAIVSELVQAMQGRCWIDSLAGGTRVNFEFSRSEADGG